MLSVLSVLTVLTVLTVLSVVTMAVVTVVSRPLLVRPAYPPSRRRRPGPRAGSRPPWCVRRAYRNELISIVSSRPGPTPIAEIGAPDISSRALTYAWAFFGRSEKDFALVMSSLQPGSVS